MREKEEEIFKDAVNKAKVTIMANLETIRPLLARQIELRQRVADLITPILVNLKPYQELSEPIFINQIIPENKIVSLSFEDRKEIVNMLMQRLNKKEKPIITRASYSLPKNASWEGLRIKFFDGHTVKVKYPSLPVKTFDYKDMGFKNNKTQNPNLYWKFLKALAENGGTYSISNTFNRQFCRQTKFETAKRLKAFFGLRTDPFYRYCKREGLKPKFALLNDTDITPLGDD